MLRKKRACVEKISCYLFYNNLLCRRIHTFHICVSHAVKMQFVDQGALSLRMQLVIDNYPPHHQSYTNIRLHPYSKKSWKLTTYLCGFRNDKIFTTHALHFNERVKYGPTSVFCFCLHLLSLRSLVCHYRIAFRTVATLYLWNELEECYLFCWQKLWGTYFVKL